MDVVINHNRNEEVLVLEDLRPLTSGSQKMGVKGTGKPRPSRAGRKSDSNTSFLVKISSNG